MEATVEEVSKDRISELPDSLIHHVLSFLDIEFVKNTCMLSRRWRYLWLSLPTLRIDESCIDDDDNDDFVTFNRFINFVDRLLLLRDTSSVIQTLELSWVNVTYYLDKLKLKYDISSRLATWIMAAVKHSLRELVIHICTDQMIKLPDCLFTHKSLTKLDFYGGGSDFTAFVLPNITMYLPWLRYLAFAEVSVIGDGNLTSRLFSSCRVLESLLLTNCSINFDFTSLSLKHFELNNCDTDPDDYTNTIKLSAPNLTSLICIDYMSQDYCLENLSSLVTATIGMRVERRYTSETPETYSELATEVKELYGARMIKYVKAVRNVTDLTLSISPGFLEVLSGSLYLLDVTYFQFRNLRSLEVVTWVSKNCMSAIAHLVKISPNIKYISLTIKKVKLDTNNTGSDWIVDSSFPCLHYLKFVQLRGIQGSLNELKFLQVLLAKATVLEKVTLFCSRGKTAARLMDFKEKLLAFPSASSSVSISIQS